MNSSNGNEISTNNEHDNNNDNDNSVEIPVNNDKVKLTLNSGIVTQIYTMIINCISDFHGFLLGRWKIIEVNNEKNQPMKITLLIIDQVISIYDKVYINEKLERLVKKILRKYSSSKILSIFTAKAFSFPFMSIKDQEFYFKVDNILRLSQPQELIETDQNTSNRLFPLLFGSFVHNVESKSAAFSSCFYFYETTNLVFKTIPYEITTLQNLSNKTHHINPNTNRSSNQQMNKDIFETQVSSLRAVINLSLTNIDETQKTLLKETKVEIKAEVEEFKSLLNKIMLLINNKL